GWLLSDPRAGWRGPRAVPVQTAGRGDGRPDLGRQPARPRLDLLVRAAGRRADGRRPGRVGWGAAVTERTTDDRGRTVLGLPGGAEPHDAQGLGVAPGARTPRRRV